jgi:FkbM family methyltransferase
MTIKRNHKINKFVAVNNWVWDKNETLTLKNGGSSSSINNDKLSWKTETINIVTIDDYVTNHNLIPWLIKRDIEWFELESLKWAEKTIKKYKPLLLISIYHTGKDFFEIKPLIESYNLWYIYQIVHNNPLHPYYETVLICH